MIVELPDVNEVFEKLLMVRAEYNGTTLPIHDWIEESRLLLERNKKLILGNGENDLDILFILYRDLLMRAMKGERGEHMAAAMKKFIKSKNDLKNSVFEKVVSECKYRWHKDGIQVMADVAEYFKKRNWNWTEYFNQASENVDENFLNDELLAIPHVGLKVRDLAISNFNENYIAADIHIVRVTTRLGLLNYGFKFLPEQGLEMGNNPLDQKHYLFLHRLFLELSEMTDCNYSLADIDRIFWHFGRTYCEATPKCSDCPIKEMCLTGKQN